MSLPEDLKTLLEELERGNKARRLLAVVAEMRVAQREYFDDRRKERLIKAKELEARVDAGLEELRRK